MRTEQLFAEERQTEDGRGYIPSAPLPKEEPAQEPQKQPAIDAEFLKKRPLSFSSLKAFKSSPRHFMHYLTAPKETTPAMIEGSAFHGLLLQPDLFDKKFAVALKVDGRTNAGKAYNASFALENNGKEIITTDQHNLIKAMVASVNSNEQAMDLINSMSYVEQKINFNIEGLPIVLYKDAASDNCTVEIKTCQDSSLEAFKRDAYNNGYYLQGGIYSYPKKMPLYYIVVEKSLPYNVSVFRASDPYIEAGIMQFERLVKSFIECMKTNGWNKGYEWHEKNSLLTLPKWAII